MSRPVFSRRQQLALATPGALLLIMYAVFQGCVALFGYPLGYLIAFLVYWMGLGAFAYAEWLSLPRRIQPEMTAAGQKRDYHHGRP